MSTISQRTWSSVNSNELACELQAQAHNKVIVDCSLNTRSSGTQTNYNSVCRQALERPCLRLYVLDQENCCPASCQRRHNSKPNTGVIVYTLTTAQKPNLTAFHQLFLLDRNRRQTHQLKSVPVEGLRRYILVHHNFAADETTWKHTVTKSVVFCEFM